MYRYPYRCKGRGNCTKAQLRSTVYFRLLRVLYKKRLANKLLRTDEAIHDQDFIQSGIVINMSGLDQATSWLYDCLTSLAEEGLLERRDSPTHKQAKEFAITAQGLSCYRCYIYRLTEQRLEEHDDEQLAFS